MIPKELIPALKDLVHELVAGNFRKLERDGRAGRLTAKDLHHVLEGYGRTLIDLPDEAFQIGEAYPIEGKEDQYWAVDLDLWTLEEGRSDLTLTLTVRTTDKGVLTEIDDLHAL
ncbi:MAG TPA: hypothetical protein VJM12_02170 [Pyrinomonadaceae bacterium]|nr:hypothetical protein [Pyrinomonadaceae bacterium]